VGKSSHTSFRIARFSPSFLSIQHWVFKLDDRILTTALLSLRHTTLGVFRDEHRFMRHASDIGAMMRLWITTAAALPYTDDVCRTVVDTLLQMAGFDVLLLHIPTVAWDWLKKRPLLRPGCWGLVAGTRKDVVLKVLRFGDVELITSYLFVVWSEWSHLHRWSGGCPGMFRMIRELNGVGAAGHRADLIRRLEYVLSQLDPTSSEKQNYEEFRKALSHTEVAIVDICIERVE